MNGFDRLGAHLSAHPAATAVAVVAGLVVAGVLVWGVTLMVRSARRRGMTGEQAGTLLAAALATGVSAQGMWVFFGKSLHLPLSLRIMFFAFLEIMVLTSALRARAAQLHGGGAGVDGVAMWVLTCLSAVLAATDADNAGTVLIRLSAPLVAAWGWERSMALERRRSGNLGGINWRITPERILIRLRLADPTDRTASQVAAQRRLIDVALATDHARTLRDTGAGARRVDRATRRLRKAMRRAVEDGGLVDNGRAPRTVLLDNIRILSGATALLDLDLPDPWTAADAVAYPRAGGSADGTSHSEAATLASAGAVIAPTDAMAARIGEAIAWAGDPTMPIVDPAPPTGNATPPTGDAIAVAGISAMRANGHGMVPQVRAAQGDSAAARNGAASSQLPPATAPDQAQPEPMSNDVPATYEPYDAWAPVANGKASTPAPSRAVPDRAMPDQSGPDQSGPDQSGPDQSGPDQAAPDHGESNHAEPDQVPDPAEPDLVLDPPSDPFPTGRLPRRDPAVRARVQELRAAETPTTEIAAELGISPRTVGRIVADMEADSAPANGTATRNLAKAAISSWHNGFPPHDGNGNGNGNAPATPMVDAMTADPGDN